MSSKETIGCVLKQRNSLVKIYIIILALNIIKSNECCKPFCTWIFPLFLITYRIRFVSSQILTKLMKIVVISKGGCWHHPSLKMIFRSGRWCDPPLQLVSPKKIITFSYDLGWIQTLYPDCKVCRVLKFKAFNSGYFQGGWWRHPPLKMVVISKNGWRRHPPLKMVVISKNGWHLVGAGYLLTRLWKRNGTFLQSLLSLL